MTDDPRAKVLQLGLRTDVYDYALAHSHADPLLEQLAATTIEQFPDLGSMITSPDQTTLLTMLARATKARVAVEVGTFTGSSALAIARGLAAGGRLHCFDRSDEFVSVGRPFWERAGVADRIEVHLGDAHSTLHDTLPTLDDPIDLAYIDADKAGYPDYLEVVLAHLAPDGLVVIDNTLWSARVLEPERHDEQVRAVAAFNDAIAARQDLLVVMLPFADGVTFVQRGSRGH